MDKLNLYVYSEGEKIVGCGRSVSENYTSTKISTAEFNLLDADTIESGLYILSDGHVVENTEISASIKAIQVRMCRDNLLDDCDWTVLPDSPLSDEEKDLWTEYRQALRDIPQQEGFPFDVEFPERPV